MEEREKERAFAWIYTWNFILNLNGILDCVAINRAPNVCVFVWLLRLVETIKRMNQKCLTTVCSKMRLFGFVVCFVVSIHSFLPCLWLSLIFCFIFVSLSKWDIERVSKQVRIVLHTLFIKSSNNGLAWPGQATQRTQAIMALRSLHSSISCYWIWL